MPRRDRLDETRRVRAIWEESADKYDKQMNWFDKHLFAGGREWITSRAHGKTLEVAVGTGRNLSFYGPNVDVTGVDLSPATLAIARDRVTDLGREVELQEADVQNLPFGADTFDTVVAGLCMCSFPDPMRAVSEIKRVLKPGGSLVSLDHVRSPVLAVRLVQKAINPLAVRFEGDHIVREPLEYYRAHGFEIIEVGRSKWGIVERAHAKKLA
jgi:ubiquinone/menaquinone biosynthesis C-methylase UbiE